MEAASRFVVEYVFHPRHRAGPLVAGRAEGLAIEHGTRLVLAGDPPGEATVLEVEFATEQALAEGKATLVLSSDLDGQIQPVVELHSH